MFREGTVSGRWLGRWRLHGRQTVKGIPRGQTSHVEERVRRCDEHVACRQLWRGCPQQGLVTQVMVVIVTVIIMRVYVILDSMFIADSNHFSLNVIMVAGERRACDVGSVTSRTLQGLRLPGHIAGILPRFLHCLQVCGRLRVYNVKVSVVWSTECHTWNRENRKHSQSVSPELKPSYKET